MCFRILRRLGAKWLPRGLRAMLAAALWLTVLPLLTAHIYHGWMNKISAISDRWTWELVKRDIVSGAVIAVIVVVSFLSLMSFAEFLRFEWAGPDQDGAAEGAAAPAGRGGGGGGRRRNRNRGNRGGGAVGAGGDRIIPAPIEGEVDDIVRPDDSFRDSYQLESDDEDLNIDFPPTIPPDFELGRVLLNGDDDVMLDQLYGDDFENDDEDFPILPPIPPIRRPDNNDAGVLPQHGDIHDNADELDEEDALEAFMRAQEEHFQGDDGDDEDDDFPILPPIRPANPPPDARFEPQFEPLDPPFPDMPPAPDDIDGMELNVALDELLGFRGPILALLRNLLWLLVFNTAYLGTFAFIPSFGGRGVYRILSKFRFIRSWATSIPGVETLLDAVAVTIEELYKESEKSNLVFHPAEIARIGLGYLGWAWGVFFLKSVIKFATRRQEARNNATQDTDDIQRQGRVQIEDGIPRMFAERERQREENNGENAARKRLIGFVDSAAAIAKVIILLCIKMLFLPLSLGVCLDIATLDLFQQSWNDRIAYAGKDLFASVFLHWVVGITFMLLVTVSVLQLREVVHPDILARIIRPQEPQPDLLGNLLQETGSTHTKRILMSLGIYAALLGIHIWIPSRLLLSYNISQYLPIFQPKFWHIFMPQIQVPLELFVFHLCMLGFLEKYKNNIGEIQHHWLILMGNILKMTNQILPREVDQFTLLGTLPVFAKDATIEQFDTSDDEKRAKVIDCLKDDIYPLWNELLSEDDVLKRVDLIQSAISRLDPPQMPLRTNGELHRNGKLLLSSHTYIRFPAAYESPKLFVKSSDKESNLLPTAIGPFRLRQKKSRKKIFIEVWIEIAGKLIPRPPEGWDDLGVGGAERQGRWAWGDEQLSEIENSVATRAPFFEKDVYSRLSKSLTWILLLLKTSLLLLISWVAITASVCTGINMPLYVGHYALDVLRVSPDCVHDPLAFAIGVGSIVPIIASIAKLSNASNDGLKGVPALLFSWIRSFKPHQSREKMKTLVSFVVLWFGICPMLLGSIYQAFFLGVSNIGIIDLDHHTIVAGWKTGTMLLNLWATVCYFRLLTIDFWVRVFAAEGQGNANANANGGEGPNANNPARNAQAQPANNDEIRNVFWQGEDGAIGRCVKSIMEFAPGWEWDKLDKNALLQDSSMRIFRHLAISCLVPWAMAYLLSQADVFLTSTIVRLIIVVTILIDFVSSNRESLQRWFEAAHKVARDDRYLIGEVLLNYVRSSALTA